MRSKSKFFGSEKINCIIQFVFCCLFVYFFAHVGISPLQMFKDIYFYAGLCALYLVLLSIKKSRLFAWPKILFSVVVFAGILFYQYYHRNDWGYQYRDMLIAKHVSYLLFALVVWDVIERRKKTSVSVRNKVLAILFIMAFIYAAIMDRAYIFVIVAPVFAWYSSGMDKEEWMRFVKTLVLSSYTVFIIVMTWSLITSPDGFDKGRYIGFFNFPAIGGTLASLALISGCFIWDEIKSKFSKAIWRLLSLIAILLYPTVALFMFTNRAAFIGMFFVLLVMYITSARENRKKKAKKRAAIVFAAVAALMIVGALGIEFLRHADLSEISQYLSERGDKFGAYGINHLVMPFTLEESYMGVFEAGSVSNILDRMSSGRLTLWYLGIKNVSIFSASDLGVMLPDGEYYGHVHNTYLDWFLRLGIIGGILMALWFTYCIVQVIKRHLEYDETVAFSFCWLVFDVAFLFFERESWTTIPTFMILVLQYPLLLKLRGEELETKRCENNLNKN